MLQLYKNIKSRRLELGLTQSDLAKALGYSDKSMIAKIEKGIIDLPQTKIMLFAEALHIHPGDLMGFDDNYYEDPTIERFDREFEISMQIIEDAGYSTSFSDSIPYDGVVVVKNKANDIVSCVHDYELVGKYEALQSQHQAITATALLGLDKDPSGYSKFYSIPVPGSAKYDFGDIDNRLTDIIYNYQGLNDKGKTKAYEYVTDLAEQPKYQASTTEPVLNAAHQRTDINIPEDIDTSDDEIMDDEDF